MISIPGTYYLLPFRGLKATYHLFPATYFLLICWTSVLRGFQIHPVTGHLSGELSGWKMCHDNPPILAGFFLPKSYQNHSQNTSKYPIQIYQCLSWCVHAKNLQKKNVFRNFQEFPPLRHALALAEHGHTGHLESSAISTTFGVLQLWLTV